MPRRKYIDGQDARNASFSHHNFSEEAVPVRSFNRCDVSASTIAPIASETGNQLLYISDSVFTDSEFSRITFEPSKETVNQPNIRHCSFSDCDFSNALINASWSEHPLLPRQITSTSEPKGQIVHSSFDNCTLDGAVFSGLPMHDNHWEGCSLNNTSFYHADMQNNIFTNMPQPASAHFENCDLRGSDLSAFSALTLIDSDLRDIDLNTLALDGLTVQNCTMSPEQKAFLLERDIPYEKPIKDTPAFANLGEQMIHEQSVIDGDYDKQRFDRHDALHIALNEKYAPINETNVIMVQGLLMPSYTSYGERAGSLMYMKKGAAGLRKDLLDEDNQFDTDKIHKAAYGISSFIEQQGFLPSKIDTNSNTDYSAAKAFDPNFAPEALLVKQFESLLTIGLQASELVYDKNTYQFDRISGTPEAGLARSIQSAASEMHVFTLNQTNELMPLDETKTLLKTRKHDKRITKQHKDFFEKYANNETAFQDNIDKLTALSQKAPAELGAAISTFIETCEQRAAMARDGTLKDAPRNTEQQFQHSPVFTTEDGSIKIAPELYQDDASQTLMHDELNKLPPDTKVSTGKDSEITIEKLQQKMLEEKSR